MSRYTPRTKVTALLLLAMLGGASIAFAQTATVKARDPEPPPPTTATPLRGPGSPEPYPAPGAPTATVKGRDPVTPSARIDFGAIGRHFAPELSFSVPILVNVNAHKVHTGVYTHMTKESSIGVQAWSKHNPSALPPGTYKLRIEVSDITQETKLLVEANGAKQVCNFRQSPGYQSAQSCEVTLASNGAPINAKISYTQGPPDFALRSIDVSKIR